VVDVENVQEQLKSSPGKSEKVRWKWDVVLQPNPGCFSMKALSKILDGEEE
jgi:hypothetical protein